MLYKWMCSSILYSMCDRFTTSSLKIATNGLWSCHADFIGKAEVVEFFYAMEYA